MLTKGDQQRAMAMPRQMMVPPTPLEGQVMMPGQAASMLASLLAGSSGGSGGGGGGLDLGGLKDSLGPIREWMKNRGAVQLPQLSGGELMAAQRSSINNPSDSY